MLMIYHVYVSDHWHPLQQEETPEKALNLLLFRKECGNRYFSWKYIDFASGLISSLTLFIKIEPFGLKNFF